MANIRLIRRRIRSIQSTAKITRAMEMVAASKMRRAQEASLAGRPYSEKILQVIADLAAIPQEGKTVHPLLQCRPVTKITVVFITPDRGLCGGLCGNINRKTASFVLEQDVPVNIITVGRKGLDFMRRYGREIQAEFSQLGDRPGLLDTLPISRIIIDDYTNGVIDAAYLAYAQFVSTIVQRPILQPLLPIEPAAIPGAQSTSKVLLDLRDGGADIVGVTFVDQNKIEINEALFDPLSVGLLHMLRNSGYGTSFDKLVFNFSKHRVVLTGANF